jgi:hypothetical protein
MNQKRYEEHENIKWLREHGYPQPDVEKMKWLELHGYEQHSGNLFEITISIPSHTLYKAQSPFFKHIISMDQVESMSLEELDQYDIEIWMRARREIARLREKTGQSIYDQQEEAE